MANFNPSVFLQDIKTFFTLAGSVLRGQHKMPWGICLLSLVCLGYLISPVDFLPDVMPVLGITDDGAFLLLVLALWHKKLSAFRQEQAQPKEGQTVIDAEAVKSSPTKRE